MNEDITVIDKVPVELLRAGPERYAAMRPTAKGSWRTISYNGIPIAIAWTDWKDSFDIINLRTDEPTDRLSNYVITAKALDIPAGWAYSSLEKTVAKYDFEREVALSAETKGRLGDILLKTEEALVAGDDENGIETES
jgi:hypothetical protein